MRFSAPYHLTRTVLIRVFFSYGFPMILRDDIDIDDIACHDDSATTISLSHEHNEGLSLHSKKLCCASLYHFGSPFHVSAFWCPQHCGF